GQVDAAVGRVGGPQRQEDRGRPEPGCPARLGAHCPPPRPLRSSRSQPHLWSCGTAGPAMLTRCRLAGLMCSPPRSLLLRRPPPLGAPPRWGGPAQLALGSRGAPPRPRPPAAG